MTPFNQYSLYKRTTGKSLNILCAPTHERYQSNLAVLPHHFYMITCGKKWNFEQEFLPLNHHIISPADLNELKFDLVLCQNRFDQYRPLKSFAEQLDIPFLLMEHTVPFSTWSDKYIRSVTSLPADKVAYIGPRQKEAWLDDREDAIIIPHAIDTDFWRPAGLERKDCFLFVVHDYKNRGNILGYNIFSKIKERFPKYVQLVGHGNEEDGGVCLNKYDLLKQYQDCCIFVNTSLDSPLPTSLLEAMSCGTPVITTDYYDIQPLVKHEDNCLIARTEEEFIAHIMYLFGNMGLSKKMGENARQTIKDNCNMDNHLRAWEGFLTNV